MTKSLLNSWNVLQVAEACGGRAMGDLSLRPEGLGNDGRKMSPGCMFVALVESRDGHDFIDQARQNGARMFLVSEGRVPALREGEAAIAVPETFLALEKLARSLFRAHGELRQDRRTLALTGSNGKTTTKNLLGSILEGAFADSALVTAGNLNNHIGLPLTLARLGTLHSHVVLEMGASRPGDIRQLIGMAPCERVLVTSVGPSHLEGLGDLAGVAREKGSIASGEPAPEVAVIPQEWLQGGLLSADFKGQIRTVGETEAATVSLEAYRPGSPSEIHLVLRPPLTEQVVRLELRSNLLGRHNAMNLMSALAVSWDLLPEEGRESLVAKAVSSHKPTGGRLFWKPGAAPSSWVLDDTYNANPSSMLAALQAHGERIGPRWAILGDMLELGPQAHEAHEMLGRQAAQLGCERIWAVGAHAAATLQGAREGGVDDLASFESSASCAAQAKASLAARDVVLVKGSRGVRLEWVVAALCEPSLDSSEQCCAAYSSNHEGRGC